MPGRAQRTDPLPPIFALRSPAPWAAGWRRPRFEPPSTGAVVRMAPTRASRGPSQGAHRSPCFLHASHQAKPPPRPFCADLELVLAIPSERSLFDILALHRFDVPDGLLGGLVLLPILRLLNSAAVLYDAHRNRHNGHHFGCPLNQ